MNNANSNSYSYYNKRESIDKEIQYAILESQRLRHDITKEYQELEDLLRCYDSYRQNKELHQSFFEYYSNLQKISSNSHQYNCEQNEPTINEEFTNHPEEKSDYEEEEIEDQLPMPIVTTSEMLERLSLAFEKYKRITSR